MKLKTLVSTVLLTMACAGNGFAQTKFVTLGTQGGPIPSSASRAQPSNALIVGDRVYVIDAGDGALRQIYAAGIDLRKVKKIFITHDHDDHNAGWGPIIGVQWDLGIPPADVYGPSAKSMMKGFQQYFAVNARIRQADSKNNHLPPEQAFNAHDIKGSGLVYQDDLISVSAQENCHFLNDPNTKVTRKSQDKSYALRIQTLDKTIVVSGDTGRCAVLSDFAKDADLLVHEVVDLPLIREMMRRQHVPDAVADGMMRHMAEEHTVSEDIGLLAKAAGVKKVILTHLVPGGDEPDSRYTDGVRKHFGGPVEVARDLMVFE